MTWFVIIGDNKFGGYRDVSDINFSPDGEKVAYGTRNFNGIISVVICNSNNKVIYEQERFNYLSDPIIFSSDSKNIAYVVSSGEKYFVVVNGEKYGEYEYIWEPEFIENDKKISYYIKKGIEIWRIVKNIEQ